MSEHSGAEVSKTQLHLRVGPELLELLDSVRGPATRNAYAAMLLERALAGQVADTVAASWGEGRSAAREVKSPRRTEPREVTTEAAAVPPSVPDLGVALTVASALPKPKRKPKPDAPESASDIAAWFAGKRS